MKESSIAALVLLTAATVCAGDGSNPDLSGTWRLNHEGSRLEMTAPTESVFVVEHTETHFKLTRTHTWGERSDTISFEVPIDGEEHHRKVRDFETWSRMYWLGHELVLDQRIAYRGEEGTNVVHYRLEDGGKYLVAAEWYHMPERHHHNLWVFDCATAE